MCNETIRNFFYQWRAWIKPFLAGLYILLVIIIVPTLIAHSISHGFKQSDQVVLVGGGFVLLTLPISIWQITQHIVHYTKPSLQKHIIRVLWMVPIYALNAWLGLIIPEQSIYMDSFRECYEAYAIYNFMKFLLNYLTEDRDLESVLESKPQVYHLFPLCWLTPWPMGSDFIHNCKHGILQYTVVRPLTTILSVICELGGVYGESDFNPHVAYPYMLAVNNLSQFIAMYCLVLFYQANKEELRPMKPIGKFFCIKAVVFFSFFQGVIITILAYFGVLKSIFNLPDDSNVKVVSSRIQDFLICIEMFLAAIAHHYSFSYKPYVSTETAASSPTCFGSLMAMLDLSDVKRDISEHLGVVGSSVSRRLRGKTSYSRTRGRDETEPLVVPVDSSTINIEQNDQTPTTSTQYGALGVPTPTSSTQYGSLEVPVEVAYEPVESKNDVC